MKLWYKTGRANQGAIDWGPSRHYDNGQQPNVALNREGMAVEVHKNQHCTTLYHRVGRISGDRVGWGQSLRYDRGITPSVALNDAGVVVEVHQSQSTRRLWYNVGQLEPHAVRWRGKGHYGSGKVPQVAINNAGVVVEVHQSSSAQKIWYRVGSVVDGTNLSFGRSVQMGSGHHPSVALTDDGLVIVTLQFSIRRQLLRRIGRIDGTTIDWMGQAVYYDDGRHTSVAASGNLSVEVHEGALLPTLWASTSLVTNRASWMEERLDTLANRRLRELVLPASHDAAMYPGWWQFTSVSTRQFALPLPLLGKTQSLSLLGQLMAGLRYFDLRPRWIGRKFVTYHGRSTDPISPRC